jgi:hypothetical protein
MITIEELEKRVQALRENFKRLLVEDSPTIVFDRGYTLGCIHAVDIIIEEMRREEKEKERGKAP